MPSKTGSTATRGGRARGSTTADKSCLVPCCTLGVCAFIYFVFFPEDIIALTAPFANLENVLTLSQAVSPWLYLLASAGILSWTITAVWGKRR